jgi:hypothetical protein
MSVPQPKLHSALTADEARESIILDFTNQLRSRLIASGLEGQHVTLCNAEWVGGVRVKMFLRKPVDVKIVGSHGEAGDFDEEVEVSASIEREVKNPETVREELKAGEIRNVPVSDVFPDEQPSDLPPSVQGFTDEAPFILSRSDDADPSGIETETRDAFVDDVLSDAPPPLDGATIKPDTSLSLCEFCSKPLSDNPNGVRSHMRIHVREGVAVEFYDGNGERAWRRM